MLRTSWVEIPVKDLERALTFYQTVFDLPPTDILADDVRRISILALPSPEGQAGVSLNQTSNFEPSDQGVLVYFFVEPDLSLQLSRIEAAGGAIIEPKNVRPAGGFFATIKDTEGNLLILNSPS